MKKKRLLPALILLVLLILVGWWFFSTEPKTIDSQESLKGLGYWSGYEPAPSETGVTVHENAAYSGLNVWSSGHRKVVFLMDMEGHIIHKWHLTASNIFPKFDEKLVRDYLDLPQFIRKVHPFPDGSIIVILDYVGMVKLDKNSNVLWKVFDKNHHDVAVDHEGSVYSLTVKTQPVEMFGITRDRKVGHIVKYSDTGQWNKSVSLLKAFRNSRFASMLAYLDTDTKDIFHANSLQLLENGNFLVSLRTLNAIAEVDVEHVTIPWLFAGRFSEQHEAQFLLNGNLLLFDNGTLQQESRAVEFDPETEEIIWEYGQKSEELFFSRVMGAVQRLKNGNTLITDTTSGRAFEVTREGEIVWEYVNPHTIGNGDTVAAIYQMERFSTNFFDFVSR